MFTLKKVTFNDYVLTQLQENIESALKQVDTVFTGGNVVSVKLNVGSNTIEHKLNKQPQGWIIVDKLGNSDIYRVSWDKYNLILNASTLVEVKIFIY